MQEGGRGRERRREGKVLMDVSLFLFGWFFFTSNFYMLFIIDSFHGKKKKDCFSLLHPCLVRPGDRIAQLIIEQISTPDVVEVDELDSTERGDGGFGHTGMRGDVESSNMCRELVEESNQ